MANLQSLLSLDPNHVACIGGRTVKTCGNCAGNAPRGSICTICDGRGFNIFICARCNPAAAAAAASIRVGATSASATANTTPGSSAPSSPGSLSRSPSTSYPSHPDARTSRIGDGNRDRTNCGRVETNTPRDL